MKKLILTTVIALLVSNLLYASKCLSPQEKEAYRAADALLKKMTLAEKIGQLQQFSAYETTVVGPEGEKRDLEKAIRNGEIGSLIAGYNPKESHRMQRIAVEESRMGIPLIFGSDIIHGCKIIFPENIAMSCSWDIEAIERSARIAAEESAAMGLHWTFSPMCDISSDPRWGRVSEGSGEDPYLASKITAAMVRGFQGDDLSSDKTIAACVKHFAAYGAP